MKESQDWKTDSEKIDSEIEEQARRRKRWYMCARIMKIALSVIWIVACLFLLYTVAPYATGKETFEDPLSNSQIQGILTLLVICFAMTKVKL